MGHYEEYLNDTKLLSKRVWHLHHQMCHLAIFPITEVYISFLRDVSIIFRKLHPEMSPGHPVPSTMWHAFGPNVYIPFTQTRWPQEGHNRRAQQNPRQDVHKNPTKPKTRCPQESIRLPQTTQMTTDDNQWTQPYSLRMAGTRWPLSFEYFCILVPLRDSTDNFTILIRYLLRESADILSKIWLENFGHKFA